MTDPLVGFDWNALYSRYDSKCKGFDPNSRHLKGVRVARSTDRLLYYALLAQAAPAERGQLTSAWYEALVYWKLYSQNPTGSISWLKGVSTSALQVLLAKLPNDILADISEIVRLIDVIGEHPLVGMKNGISVRTAFLHLLYPHVVPIFDRNVLRAVGAWFENANYSISVLREYIPHAWTLADRHAQSLPFPETPVRLVDMALWVERG